MSTLWIFLYILASFFSWNPLDTAMATTDESGRKIFFLAIYLLLVKTYVSNYRFWCGKKFMSYSNEKFFSGINFFFEHVEAL